MHHNSINHYYCNYHRKPTTTSAAPPPGPSPTGTHVVPSGTRIENCDAPGKFVMTFDDGPMEPTSQIISILNANNVKATFFVVGSVLALSKHQTAFNAGHQIGAHS